MNETSSFASLTPTLLARKGGAKPAMRPQLQPLFHDSLARTVEDDLGWNDMGEDIEAHSAEVVSIVPEVVQPPVKAPRPAVVRQREEIETRVAAKPAAPKRARVAAPAERRSALDQGRRAAFTLRVDGERHLKLRLACTLRNRSAQQLVTEALDRLLSELPELGDLAARIADKR